MAHILFLLNHLMYINYLNFLTFFRHLLARILHASNNVQEFYHKILFLVLFHFRDELVYGLLLLYVCQILRLNIYDPLQSTLNAILDNICPRMNPISLNDFLVPLSIVQNHLDVFYLDLHQFLLLCLFHLHLYLIIHHIYLVLMYQNIQCLLFRMYTHLQLFVLHILPYILYALLLLLLLLAYQYLIFPYHLRIFLYNNLLFQMDLCALILLLSSFYLHLRLHLKQGVLHLLYSLHALMNIHYILILFLNYP